MNTATFNQKDCISWGKFLSFAASSVLYNVGIILGIVIIYPAIGLSGLAWGVVLGSGLHFFVQWLEAHIRGWRYRLVLKVDRHVRRIFLLMIPRTLGLAANQVALVITTAIASTLAPGSLSAYNFSYNLQGFPIGIFGISLAVAAFPVFSRAWSRRDAGAFNQILVRQLRRILFFLAPLRCKPGTIL